MSFRSPIFYRFQFPQASSRNDIEGRRTRHLWASKTFKKNQKQLLRFKDSTTIIIFAANSFAMKKLIVVFLLGLAALFCACNHQQDSLIGTWVVDKVNVQFDEKRSTPELVKQIGEMERQNSFSISTDSTLTFKGLDAEWQGKISLKSDGMLVCDDSNFGIWKDGLIVTQTESPLGEVMVTYKKK